VKLVVDASVAIKWFLVERPNELYVDEAQAVGQAIDEKGAELFAPPHWIAEVLGVLCRLDPDIVDGAMETFLDLRPTVLQDGPVLVRATGLSISLRHHLFDTLYHAVALETGATLVTADERYFEKSRQVGSITLLKDFAA